MKSSFFLYIFIFTSIINAQIVYTPLNNGVYDYLDRMSLKKLIVLNDEVRPFSRTYIASLIKELDKKRKQLNNVESDLLNFYSREYSYELNTNIIERWFLYSYSDSLFSIKVSPIAGYGISATGDAKGHTRWIGFSTYGSYKNWFGASFDIRDKGEYGNNVDKDKTFSPQSGASYKSVTNGIEYSDVKGSINFDWGWGGVSLLKEYFKWGHGKFGQLILSSKSPDYPRIEFHLKPVNWLRFSYIHGWLNSLVIDSSSIYYDHASVQSPRTKESYINKYIAANILTISPLSGLDLSIGNSFIYSGDLRPEMFIPFMFYKWLDHNTGRGGVNDGNGTLYCDVSARFPREFIFYGTLFIDVTEIRNILENEFRNTLIGFTLGTRKINLFIDNLDVTLEYTRINPWVYEHKYKTTTYKHLDYSLGHWIGQNADQFRIQFNYQLLRGLKFQFYFERVRKGGLDDIYYAYEGLDEFNKSFLYTPLRVDKSLGLNVSYEYLLDLIIKSSLEYSNISDSNISRTPKFMLGKKFYYSIMIYYGM